MDIYSEIVFFTSLERIILGRNYREDTPMNKKLIWFCTIFLLAAALSTSCRRTQPLEQTIFGEDASYEEDEEVEFQPSTSNSGRQLSKQEKVLLNATGKAATDAYWKVRGIQDDLDKAEKKVQKLEKNLDKAKEDLERARELAEETEETLLDD